MDDEFGLLNDKEQAFIDAYNEKIRTEERERILEVVKDVRDDFVHDPAYGFTLVISYLEGELD